MTSILAVVMKPSVFVMLVLVISYLGGIDGLACDPQAAADTPQGKVCKEAGFEDVCPAPTDAGANISDCKCTAPKEVKDPGMPAEKCVDKVSTTTAAPDAATAAPDFYAGAGPIRVVIPLILVAMCILSLSSLRG